MAGMATHITGCLLELNFSVWKIFKKKSQSRNSKLEAVLKVCRDFGEGQLNVLPPGLPRVKWQMVTVFAK